jgi:hypothetical protein
MFRVFKEIWIKVNVSSQTSVGIRIPKIGLLEDLQGGGCDFNHLPHLTRHPSFLIDSNVSLK